MPRVQPQKAKKESWLLKEQPSLYEKMTGKTLKTVPSIYERLSGKNKLVSSKTTIAPEKLKTYPSMKKLLPFKK